MSKKQNMSLLLSIFVWGSGQFFICKQRLKGLMFFAVQVFIIATELITGYWYEYALGLIPNFNLRTYGGFFTKGLWGFITLGDVKGKDHSTMLLITGIIVILMLVIGIAVYILNLKDAYKEGKQVQEKGEYVSSKKFFYKNRDAMFAYLVLTPFALLFIFVVVMPILFTVLTSFTNYNRSHLPPGNLVDWVGFKNFTNLVNVPIWSNTFTKVLGWTIVWAISATFLSYGMGFFQALMLNHPSVDKGKKIFRTVLILPWAMPQMITLLYLRAILNGQFGALNRFLLEIGIIQESIPFLSNTIIARTMVIVIAVWLGFPLFMTMILGVLANINKSLYEAATIDGATSFQVTRYITVPLVLKATAPLLVMFFARNFNAFGLVYFLTGGNPVNPNLQLAGDTDILISWIYSLSLNNQMYSMASVMTILVFVVIAVISFWNFRRTTSFKEM